MSLLRITNGFEKSQMRSSLSRLILFISRWLPAPLCLQPSPTMTVLKDAVDDFQSAVNAALNRDRVWVEQKNIARQLVIDLLNKLGYYVLFTANAKGWLH